MFFCPQAGGLCVEITGRELTLQESYLGGKLQMCNSLCQWTAKGSTERGHIKHVKNSQQGVGTIFDIFDNLRKGQKTSKIVKR